MLPILLLSYTGLAFAASYRSSFTQYGSTDGQSPNCNTATAACGFYSYPGYNAAVSQNLYGEGPGAGAGPQCGKCWQLVPEKDGNGNPIFGANTIVVKVNNLCPAQGNPLCSQDSLTSQNYLGANVNFDICIDDGAAAQFFGSSGWGLATGLAIEVDCSQWSGSPNKYSRRRLQAS